MGVGAWGLGFGVWGLGLRVWGLRSGGWGLGFGVWGLGFAVWGVGMWGFQLGVESKGPSLWIWALGVGFQGSGFRVNEGSGFRVQDYTIFNPQSLTNSNVSKLDMGAGGCVPHDSIHANRFISHLSDYCPGNTPKVSTWSRNSAVSALLRDQTNEITPRIYNDICSVRIGRLVW